LLWYLITDLSALDSKPVLIVLVVVVVVLDHRSVSTG